MTTLVDDRLVRTLLWDVHDAAGLCALPAFAGHSRDTFELYLGSCRKLARDVLFPAYRPMDETPPRLERGRVRVHPAMHAIFPKLVELGALAATRPEAVGGAQLPLTVATLAHAYLMAANLSAYGYVGLTTGAAHLIESFGTPHLRETFMRRMYAGEWTGTMALTEPQAGSSLADVTSRATPTDEEGVYRLRGSKIFISGGDHDLTENVVHMVLARIEGAPPGTRGISLFAVPARRLEDGALVDNDVAVAGLIHKIGWRGLPSLAIELGERGDCIGHLVGEPHRGLAHMFQMMNEARIMIGVNGAATASVAYHAAVAYACDRMQGRPLASRDPSAPPVPIVEHADVRRMLVRQKSIVDGALALVTQAARWADLAEHADDARERERFQLLLDLITPVAKSFPAEHGYEANVLALQVHGGYGYSSEQLPEAWLRDQKLNSIHEGTTGIQSLDLLGRKVVARGGEPLRLFGAEIAAARARAADAGVPAAWGQSVQRRFELLAAVTMELGARGMSGDVEGMLLHSADYLSAFSILSVAWQHLLLATAARRRLDERASDAPYYEGLLRSAQYFVHTELPRVDHLAELCRTAEDSYARMRPDSF